MRTYAFDASALIAFLQKPPGAYRVNELLQGSPTRASEGADVSGELRSSVWHDSAPIRLRANACNYASGEAIEVLDATAQRACHAADLKVKHKLYYADSFAAALAIEDKATLVTGDNDFRRLGPDFLITWLKS
jgi:predicted nucleic acid-binding protein